MMTIKQLTGISLLCTSFVLAGCQSTGNGDSGSGPEHLPEEAPVHLPENETPEIDNPIQDDGTIGGIEIGGEQNTLGIITLDNGNTATIATSGGAVIVGVHTQGGTNTEVYTINDGKIYDENRNELGDVNKNTDGSYQVVLTGVHKGTYTVSNVDGRLLISKEGSPMLVMSNSINRDKLKQLKARVNLKRLR
jgi:hypothetical protein